MWGALMMTRPGARCRHHRYTRAVVPHMESQGKNACSSKKDRLVHAPSNRQDGRRWPMMRDVRTVIWLSRTSLRCLLGAPQLLVVILGCCTSTHVHNHTHTHAHTHTCTHTHTHTRTNTQMRTKLFPQMHFIAALLLKNSNLCS